MFNSVTDARQTISRLREALKRDDGCSDFEVYKLFDELNQIIDTLVAVNKRDKVLTSKEITDTGEQGLALIDNLIYKLMTQGFETHRQEIEQVALMIANWVIKHDGNLINIQSVVDGIAFMANEVSDKISLLQLSKFMSQVANACSDELRRDIANSDPSRPWRTLNMNRGIVATRTHDLEIMNEVFTDLIAAIPLEAPMFFKEGMSEMGRLDYPESVSELMKIYYDKTQAPSVH